MSWITLAVVLVTWTLVGVVVAYLFGRFTHQVSGSGGELAPPVVSFLRRMKRTKTASRAATKVRRQAASGHRLH
jgi:hypothetical protein